MSRKDYRAVAAAFMLELLNERCTPETRNALARVADSIACAMAADNASFQRSTFMRACGL